LVANNNKSKKGKPKGRLKDIVKKSRGIRRTIQINTRKAIEKFA